MSKSNLFETDLLQLIFNGIIINGLAENDTTSPVTDLYVSLHTADPGEGGDQDTNEVSYPGYTRVSVIRTAGGWVVSGGSVSPAANIDFPVSSGGSETITHFGIGTVISGSGYLIYSGLVTPNIFVSTDVAPRLTTLSNVTED